MEWCKDILPNTPTLHHSNTPLIKKHLEENRMKKKTLEQFKEPGCEFRGAPFWAWNGKLEPEELRRQIRIMKQMGLGGFFMHSRVGLDTAYLSEEWFECVNACIDEAEKQDMRAWLYDEDRWPSGAAGGLVTKNHAYRAKFVRAEELKSAKGFKWTKDTIAVFAAEISGTTACNVRRIKTNAVKISKKETLLHFTLQIQGDSSWYNGQAYLDLMDKKAVKEFIKVTHEKYRKEVGKHFGKRVPGIFTDEPNFPSICPGNNPNMTSIPWSNELTSVFKKKYGYDIIDRIVELFYDVDGMEISQARYHYNDCLTTMFVEAFTKQIGEWCDENKMQHTGHLLLEDSLSKQVSCVGSCIRSYEYMQAPGMDLLTERWPEYDTAKQVSSAARQFDRKWRLTETYGCTGWDFPFKGHKALGDWQAALGINLRAQHLSWYTMLGQAKRDYPAGIFYQSPWWQQYSKVEDYFGRINAVMVNGKEIRDLLVIHANESMWTMTRKGWKQEKAVKDYDKMFVDLRNSFLDKNIDFDYGDEEILSRHGSVIYGKEPKLKLAKAEYKAVVVPPLKTMRSSTLELLKKFREAGGKVVFAGSVAKYVDALPSEEVAKFAKSCDKAPAKGAKLADSVESCRRISIKDKTGKEIDNTLYLLREDRDNSYLFICNTGFDQKQIKTKTCMVVDRKTAYDKVQISGFEGYKGEPLELNPDTGEIFKADAKIKDGSVKINTSFPALGSRLFVIPKKKAKTNYPRIKNLRISQTTKLNPKKWDVLYSEENVLVLDYPMFRVIGGKWKQEEVLKADHIVKDALGIQRRGGRMVQPWARKKDPNPDCIKIELKYLFNIKEIPKSVIYLALEKPELFRISVNGTPIDSDSECGWWCDQSLRKIAISPSFLKKGENTITMQCDYNENHPGLEIVYLLGQFGARMLKDNLNEITPFPETLKLGDWTEQGLPFYSGAVSYTKTCSVKFEKGQKVFISVPDYNGVAVRIYVNGVDAGITAWEPNEIEITELVKSNEKFDLRIELISHRRNSHGPLHHTEKWPRWTGHAEFENAEGRYNLVPCGINTAPEILVKQ
jgi:hypothetical protein